MGSAPSTSASTPTKANPEKQPLRVSPVQGPGRLNKKSKSFKVPASRSILLLGTAGVGKTTIVKQLTVSWGYGLTESKKQELLAAVRRACAQRVIDIVNYAADDQDGGPLENDSSDEQFGWLFEKAEELGFKDLAAVTAGELDAIGEDLEKMWENALVVEIQRRRITSDSDKQLSYDSADKFLPDIRRIFKSDCVLTDKEVLLVRSPTNDIEVTNFNYQNEAWAVKDVGGQVHHRNSWKTAFAGVRVVLYIVNLADYDKFDSRKDGRAQNRLMENRKLFKDVCSDAGLAGYPVVLLFNKVDLFEEKLKATPFSACPQFAKIDERSPEETDTQHTDRCCKKLFKYYAKAFSDVQKLHKEAGLLGKYQAQQKDPISYYQTCATDADFVEKSMGSVFATILKGLRRDMSSAGLM